MRTRGVGAGVLAFIRIFLSIVPMASAQDVRTGVEQLAERIVKGSPDGRQIRVAVIDFPDLQGVNSDLGRYIANRLTTRLAQSPQFFVVERQRLSQVLAELRFSMTDLVDPAKAKQLGRIVGVEAIVVGTISDLGNQVDFDARIIEIETSNMLLSATVTVSKDQFVAELLNRGRDVTAATPAPATVPVQQLSAPPKAPSQPHASKSAIISASIKESAAELAQRADKGVDTQSAAVGLIAEYNRLLLEAKAVLQNEPSIQSLKELKFYTVAQTGSMVATAARKLTALLQIAQ